MLRTHTCGELRIADLGKEVSLAGWVQKSRDLGGMTFIDMRDRYGITQLAFNTDDDAELRAKARDLGREYVIQVKGTVIERASKNAKIPTGDIEIRVSELNILNPAQLPPFLIEDETDGGDELRMKYRYLDLRRNPVRENLVLRHRIAQEVRKYLDGLNFIEVETPVLIKSTPEGARDFIVPSRMNPGEFYALPQSPQTFKQLLMVSGFDRYFQIVKCFRDEDLRADRQPEFTQIDCEMAFIEQEDILNVFEGLIRTLFKNVKGIDIAEVPRMQYADAMRLYGSDKPDIRFGMTFVELNDVVKGQGFGVFDNAELVVGIKAEKCAEYTRKQLDELTDFVKRPQIGATGLIYMRHQEDGSLKSSVDKFYGEEELKKWSAAFNTQPGDLVLVLAGQTDKVRKQLNELRLEMGNRLGLRDKNTFAPLWVLDFPLLEWDEESARYHAMHHPFTSPKKEDIDLLDSKPGEVRANAYDMVLNGTELGGGSIRIHDRELQALMFKHLGFSKEEAQKQFGFLMEAFEYGAPPHGGIAFGLDRLVSIFAGLDSIRDVIAFPKNNSGRDVMIDSPSEINDQQLDELFLIEDLKRLLDYYENLEQYKIHNKKFINEKILRLTRKIVRRDYMNLEIEKIINENINLKSRQILYGLKIYERAIADLLGLKKHFYNTKKNASIDFVDQKEHRYQIQLKRKDNLNIRSVIHNAKGREVDLILGIMDSDYSLCAIYEIEIKEFYEEFDVNIEHLKEIIKYSSIPDDGIGVIDRSSLLKTSV